MKKVPVIGDGPVAFVGFSVNCSTGAGLVSSSLGADVGVFAAR